MRDITTVAAVTPPRASLRAAHGVSMPLAGVSCLLVEDTDDAATDAAVLERAGATVAQVRTMGEGVLALAQRPWKLVLVDPALPDGSGYQVVAYAAMIRFDAAILIVSDAGCRPPSVGPFERAFTFLDRHHTGDRLVRCAQFALMRAGRRESHASRREGASPSKEFCVFDFSSRYRLSRRQQDVLTMLVAGSSPKQIAERLALSPTTVRRHSAEMYRKCGVRGQRELLALVARSC